MRRVWLLLISSCVPSDSETYARMLILMAGPPGIGKTTVARELARRTDGVILRKDVVRHALFPLAISKDISDYLRFEEALYDRLADALLASELLATRIRAEIENWKLTRVSVGAVAIDRKPKQYFVSSGSALLRHPSLKRKIISFAQLSARVPWMNMRPK